MLDYMRTSLVTFETAFLASSMKFHPVYISLLYYIAVLKIRGVGGRGWGVCEVECIFIYSEVDFHRLEFRVTDCLVTFIAVYKRLCQMQVTNV
jgi:hypothetical protein